MTIQIFSSQEPQQFTTTVRLPPIQSFDQGQFTMNPHGDIQTGPLQKKNSGRPRKTSKPQNIIKNERINIVPGTAQIAVSNNASFTKSTQPPPFAHQAKKKSKPFAIAVKNQQDTAPQVRYAECSVQQTIQILVSEALEIIQYRQRFHSMEQKLSLMSKISCEDIVRQIRRRHPFVDSWYLVQSQSDNADGWTSLVPLALLGRVGLFPDIEQTLTPTQEFNDFNINESSGLKRTWSQDQIEYLESQFSYPELEQEASMSVSKAFKLGSEKNNSPMTKLVMSVDQNGQASLSLLSQKQML